MAPHTPRPPSHAFFLPPPLLHSLSAFSASASSSATEQTPHVFGQSAETSLVRKCSLGGF
eukprot:6186334-Pleurochrysis_carterae.AAC.5